MNNVYALRMLVVFFLLLFFSEVKSQLVITSGFEMGSYNQMANDVKSLSKDSIQVLTSQGSLDNLEAILNIDNKINVAFMQYDVLINQFIKDMESGIGRSASIRILLPLGIEEVHLITTKTSGIESIKDLTKKKVAIGSEVQGTAVTANKISELTGIDWISVSLSFNDAFPALINGDVDAFFFVGAAPVAKLKSLSPLLLKVVKLVPIESEKIIRDESYSKSQITQEDYYWLDNEIPTVGVKSFLVTDTKNESEDNLQKLEKFLMTIKENIVSLRSTGHPQWKNVSVKFENLTVEVHPVAKKVFGAP